MGEIFCEKGRDLQQMSRVAKDLYLFMFKTLTSPRVACHSPKLYELRWEKGRERLVL